MVNADNPHMNKVEWEKNLITNYQVKSFPEEIAHVERSLGENAVRFKIGTSGLRGIFRARAKEQAKILLPRKPS